MAQEIRQQGGGRQDNVPRQQAGAPEIHDIGEWGEMNPGWFQRNFRNVILPIIILVIVGGGLYLYSRPEKNEEQASQEQAFEDLLDENSESSITLGEDTNVTAEETDNTAEESGVLGGPEKTVPELSGDTYAITAAQGDGITHLARRTLKKYLEEEARDVTLSAEQKIYAEDYIQNQTGTHQLAIGEEITITKDMVRNAVEASQKLTESQIKNLSQYVPLVPSLQ